MTEQRQDDDALGARAGARETLASFRAFLASPAYTNNIDLAVLTKLAADETVPHRERLRAAEMLLRFRIKAMETLAHLEGVREQILRDLGIDTKPQVSMTQVNQRIEIVRADDWRSAQPLAQGDVIDVLPEPTETHALNGHADDGEET